MKVTVVGTGYVGLVAGACFSSFGINVTCLDNNEEIIEKLKSGEITIHEPGLEDVVKNSILAGKLAFSTSKAHLQNADVIIIAVGTPQSADGSANLDYLNGVVDDIANNVTDDKVIIIKSTVPVGTAEKTLQLLYTKAPERKFTVVSNPEFLREGSAVSDFMKPDRVVIGLKNGMERETIQLLYTKLTEAGVPIFYTDNASAELIKYSSNCYLAMRLAFLNEMSDIAEVVGANIDDVSAGMGGDKRIGKHYLKVGPGFGGSCFPKDTAALDYLSTQIGAKSKIIDAVIAANAGRKQNLAERAYKMLNTNADHTVTVWGVTFKANTDDIRDSAALDIIDFMISKGVKIQAYDPSNTAQFANKYPDLNLAESAAAAAKNSDLIIICTEWEEFKSANFAEIAGVMRNKQIFDMRNLLGSSPSDDFKYSCLGKNA